MEEVASPRTSDFFRSDRPGERVQIQIARTVNLLFLRPSTDEPMETRGSLIATNFRIIFKPVRISFSYPPLLSHRPCRFQRRKIGERTRPL